MIPGGTFLSAIYIYKEIVINVWKLVKELEDKSSSGNYN